MITVGPFEISQQDDGSLWFAKEGGEGMQIKGKSLKAFIALIAKFWNAHI